jgi:hypothetical protein
MNLTVTDQFQLIVPYRAIRTLKIETFCGPHDLRPGDTQLFHLEPDTLQGVIGSWLILANADPPTIAARLGPTNGDGQTTNSRV